MVATAYPKGGVQLVRVTEVVADPRLNPRAGGTPEDVAAEWAEALDAGAEFPPGVAFRDRTGRVWLGEGFIRRRAYELAGKAFMPLDVREGDRRAAALWAAGSNRANAVYRSRLDKRRAVGIVLRECPDWTDRRIADHVGVGADLAGDVRRELSLNDSSLSPPTRVGLDGRERAMPTPPPAAPAAPAPQPYSPPARPPVIGPHRREDFAPEAAAADDGQGLLDAACLGLAAVAECLEFLAGRGEDVAALESHRAELLAGLWAGRPGKPPGA